MAEELGHDNIEYVSEENEKDKKNSSGSSQVEDIKEIGNNNGVEATTEEKRPTTHCYTINTYMIPAKVAYFINGARFELTDYLMVFYVASGLSPFQAGLLNGLQYLGSMIANPLWGLLADKKGYRRFIMIFLCFMGTITAGVQPYISYLYGDTSRNVCPAIKANKTDVSMHGIFNDTMPYHHSTNQKSLFYSFLVCAIVFASFELSIGSFIDAGILRRVQTSPRKVQIGHQRLFSSIGSSLGSIAYSASITYFPHSRMTCYTGLFVTYFVFAIATAISGFPLYSGISVKSNTVSRENVIKDLLTYLKDFDVLFFLANVLYTGICQGMLFSFLFVYLQELNAPTMLFGYSISLNSVSAVIVYSLSGRFIKLLGGPKNALCLSCFAWGFRFLFTSLLVNPYYVLILDIFHGFTYSLSKVSALTNISETVPRNIFTTMCSINNLLFLSCGFLIASMFGGFLYDVYGPRKLYLGTAIVSFIWGFINLIYLLFLRKFRRREEVITTETPSS